MIPLSIILLSSAKKLSRRNQERNMQQICRISLHMILTDVMWITCGLLWSFYQLFGLSFWRHPFTAEVVSKRCNATFLQIHSDEETNSSTSWMAWEGVHFPQTFIFGWTIPLLVSAKDAHGPLAKRLMHMAHLSGNTSGVSKSSLDWLNYTGFPGDVCVAFFNVLPGNKDAVAPNPLTKEESRRVYNWRRALIN